MSIIVSRDQSLNLIACKYTHRLNKSAHTQTHKHMEQKALGVAVTDKL